MSTSYPDYSTDPADMRNTIDSLSAENARLREALNTAMIATNDLADKTYCPCVEEGKKCKCPVYKLYEISAKARAALATKEVPRA